MNVLRLPESEPALDDPFKDDLLERKELAERLTRFLANVLHIVSFCARRGCDMQTFGKVGQYYGMDGETTIYTCNHCGQSRENQGSREHIESKVVREIQRLLRTEDWRNYIGDTRKF